MIREKRVCFSTDSYFQDYATKDYEFVGMVSSRKARKHSVLMTPSGKLYVCKQCDESFDKSYSLANHVKSFCPKRLKKPDGDNNNNNNTDNTDTNSTINDDNTETDNSSKPTNEPEKEGEKIEQEEEELPRAPSMKRKRRSRKKVPVEDSAVVKSDDRESEADDVEPGAYEEEEELLDAAIEASLASYYEETAVAKADLDVVVMDPVTLLGFPVELVNKLKSLKALKLSLDNGLIDEEQYNMKQLEFLESFKFL